MGLMEDSFIFRGKVTDDKDRLKICINGKSMYSFEIFNNFIFKY